MKNTFDIEPFVNRLRDRYNTLGLIPEDLVAFCKRDNAIPLKTVRQYFNLKTDKAPDITNLLSFSELLSCSPDYLLGFSKEPNPCESYLFEREAFVLRLRESYSEQGMLPEDLELFASRSGYDFDTLRDILNNDFHKKLDATHLTRFCTLFSSTPSELLGLTQSKQTPKKIEAAFASIRPKKNGGNKSATLSRITGMIGAGLVIAGAFAPVLRHPDGQTKILFSHPGGILLTLLGIVAVVLSSLGRFHTLRYPALGNLFAAGWAFLSIRAPLQQGTVLLEWVWLLLGLGTFSMLLASVLDADKK